MNKSLPAIAVVLLAIVSCAAGNVTTDDVVVDAKPATVDAALVQIHTDFERHRQSASSGEAFRSNVPGIQIVEGRILIDAQAVKSGESLRDDLVEMGASNCSVAGQDVSCQYPIAAIPKLASVNSLKYARPSYVMTR